jgi:hypothetical protein
MSAKLKNIAVPFNPLVPSQIFFEFFFVSSGEVAFMQENTTYKILAQYLKQKLKY